MSRKHFGTDGIRGLANRELTPELAFRVGLAAGCYVRREGLSPRAILGLDTRRSSAMLGAALAAGFCSAGVGVRSVGVVPTGCVSFLARTGAYGLGAVVSASHNPALDNGIKLIGHDGRKLSDTAEEAVEALMEGLTASGSANWPTRARKSPATWPTSRASCRSGWQECAWRSMPPTERRTNSARRFSGVWGRRS
jgi:phosphomannomutase